MRGSEYHQLTNERPHQLLIGNTGVTLETEDTRCIGSVGQHSELYLHNVTNMSRETRLMSMFVTPVPVAVLAQL